ncbi:hypothetical protein P278_09170 [Zhouia amylolytica AD3]|uniref:Uncharacterized protein n=1 Tax=Zhouia amylolytica AD3 TaxID=1286632 RepID=W2UQE6_9FLAO|nr:hypothetical protein P278_09170 [Zhouia amylolytica AD3]
MNQLNTNFINPKFLRDYGQNQCPKENDVFIFVCIPYLLM